MYRLLALAGLVLALPLAACDYSAASDRAFIDEKCAGQGPRESAAYRDCAGDVMRYLEQTRRFRSTG
ncbi:MAG: hypothetical protein KIT20_03045 [Alphaproteobacteria bacterium]|nr:hypothetical protein [Alphaproteobacteria bacterium]